MNYSDSQRGFYEEIAIHQMAKMKTYPQVTLEKLKIHHENPNVGTAAANEIKGTETTLNYLIKEYSFIRYLIVLKVS